MIRGPKFKICKRIGDEVFPQCQTPRFTKSASKLSTKNKKRGRGKSEYGFQFGEKQKMKFMYGVTERQFGNYVKEAGLNKKVSPAAGLLQVLETRLDNVIFRTGIAKTRALARQMVSHGHIEVNGAGMNVPSHKVDIGDKISIKKKSADSLLFKDIQSKLKGHKIPKWIKFTADDLTAEIIGLPGKDEIEAGTNPNAVMEFYSRT